MTIEERLENMERELGRHKRRNRWLLGAILLLAGGMIVLGVFETTASRAMEIRARSIRIEDKNGKRGLLGSEGLMLFDQKGVLRVRLSADEDGASLALADNPLRTRALLSTTYDGRTRLALFDENGKARAEVDLSKAGPRLNLRDENGNSRFAAGKTKTVSPDGKTIEYPESSLILYGPDGKVIWSAIK